MSQNKRSFPCNFNNCLSVFKKHSHLLRHQLIHSDERPYHCKENGCSSSFRSPCHLKRHEATHQGEKKYKCTYENCNVSCITEWNLKRHIKRTHDGPFKCKKCNKEFKKNKLLQQHVSLEHKSANVCCDFPGCSAIFSLPSKMKHHMKIHNKGYICSVKGCSQKFQLWSECRQHSSLCKNKEMKCSICDKVFTESHNLRAHEKIHNEEREVYQCTYDGCGRFYTKQYNLKVHVQSFHQNIRPYVCPKRYCNKSFHFQHLLRNHLEMHKSKAKNEEKDVPPRKRRRTRRLVASNVSNISGYIPELWRKMTPMEIKHYVYGDNDSCDTDHDLRDNNSTQKTCTPISSSGFVSSANESCEDVSEDATVVEQAVVSTEETLTAITTECEVSEGEQPLVLERLKSIKEAEEYLAASSIKRRESASPSPSPPSLQYGGEMLKLSHLNTRLHELAAKQRKEESNQSSSSTSVVAEMCHVQSMTESESDSEMVQLKLQHCVS